MVTSLFQIIWTAEEFNKGYRAENTILPLNYVHYDENGIQSELTFHAKLIAVEYEKWF